MNLVDGFRQSDRLLHGVLLPDVIDGSALLMRLLNIDYLVAASAADIVVTDIDLGERNLSFVKCDAGLWKSAGPFFGELRKRTLFSISATCFQGLFIRS